MAEHSTVTARADEVARRANKGSRRAAGEIGLARRQGRHDYADGLLRGLELMVDLPPELRAQLGGTHRQQAGKGVRRG